MVKIANAAKLLLAGALISVTALLPVSIAHADATNSNFVPNTTACYAKPITKTKNGGTFTAKWDNGNTFTITVTTAPTEDITLYASSYHLTSDLYKGGCFSYNPATGTSPQTYDNNTQTITIPAGFTGTKTVTVVLPDACYNEQVDLYFGNAQGQPLNGTVTSRGHDAYGYIAGNIMLTSLNQACAGGKGGGPTTPTTPTTPSSNGQVLGATTTAPALTNTGLNIRFTGIIAAALLATAAFVFTRRNSVQE